MTSKLSLDSNSSSSNLSPPLAPPKDPPKIGSSTVTNVSSEPSNKQEQTSATVMGGFQRTQASPTTTSTLSPTRVTTVVEDLDTLLDDALKEFFAISPASSSSSASTATSGLPFFDITWNLSDIEQALVDTICMPVMQLFPQLFTSTESMESITIKTAELLNRVIELMNHFFKSFAESANPKCWMDQAIETAFFRNTRPFGASCTLMAYLDRAKSLLPLLDKNLIAEWKEHYRQAVSILKKQGLDHHNETEFPFSKQVEFLLTHAKKANEQLQNPQIEKLIEQNPKWVKQQVSSLINNPATQDPQLAATLTLQLEATLQFHISFFQALDQVLQTHSNNASAIETWLKEHVNQPTYLHHFFAMKNLSNISSVIPLDADGSLEKKFHALQTIYNNCCSRLTTLGLQNYVNEGPPKQVAEQYRKALLQNKAEFQACASQYLPMLKSLSDELKKLNSAPENVTANRKAIEDWFTRAKASEGYEPPFFFFAAIVESPSSFEGVIDAAQLEEINTLYPFCRDQLTSLGLQAYLQELPQQPTTTAAPKVLTDLDRFKQELDFFRQMLGQEDLAQWLKENSPKSDYPLLWAKKRVSQISLFRETVDMDTRRDWKMCADACLEKVQGTALASYADIGQIPTDASPELKAFLSQG